MMDRIGHTASGMIIGALICFLIITICAPRPVETIKTISWTQTQKIKDYRTRIDSMEMVIGNIRATLPIIQIDTIAKPDSGMFEIPIMPYVFRCSIPLLINEDLSWAHFVDAIDGYVVEHTIITEDSIFYSKPAGGHWKPMALGSLAAAGILLVIAILK